ncbi:reverse transcriptase domain-containing protein [Tanacetum coccineum]
MVREKSIESFYSKLRESAIRSAGNTPLLIFPSTSDVDSLCAFKIIGHVLETDSVRPIHLRNLSEMNQRVVVLYTEDDEVQGDLRYGCDVKMLVDACDVDGVYEVDEDRDSDSDDEDGDGDGSRKRKRDSEDEDDPVKVFSKFKKEYYHMGTFHGKSSGCLMYKLSDLMRKSTNDLLWIACVALTDQFIHERLPNERYQEGVMELEEFILRLENLRKVTTSNLTPITSPWPFYKWGIDIAGPFPEGPGKVKFLIVAIDYFTKWIEAKPVATITGNQVKKFVCDNIVCRFGLPGEIHPQTNGLVERANRSLGEGIKARLDERSKDWIGELSHVLWAHRTMIKSSNGETPFSLTYGTEAVIPAEIGMPTLRTTEVDLTGNDYNSKVRGTSFKPGDMVYRNNDASHAMDGGKLGPKWEGPYEVTEALGKGAYKLKDHNGNELPRTWNICNLKKCYIHEV